MNHIYKIFILLFIGIQISQAQLVINELSQGPAGSQEYVELLVIGNPSCASSTVDLRGWIIDDNNSWHAAGAGNGIASGHKRFSNAAQWANVRMGALIVIYNETDVNPAVPADDETDSNNDCVYILPSSSSLFDHNTTMPTGTLTFSTYLGSPYTSTGNWSSLSMNNTNDAFHTVNPAAINGPYHAIGWGTNVDSNDIYFSGGMSNRVVRFMNTVDDNAFSQLNFSRDSVVLGGVNESPGVGNSPANSAYINYMKNSCLPFSSINITVDTSICSGNTVFAGGILRNTAGTYYDTIPGGTGCDTIKRTNLSILPTPVIAQNFSICFGETILINGIPRSAAGLYRDTLVSIRGCDSIVNSTLSLDSVKTALQNISICSGQSFFAGGINRTVNGTYFDSLTSYSGCDSVLRTNLSVLPASSTATFITKCDLDPCPIWGGIARCTAGSYSDTLSNYVGCDSVAILNLSVAISSDTLINQTICAGEVIRIGSSNYTLSGTFYDTLINRSGCDSVVTLQLLVRPSSSTTIDTAICSGDIVRIGVFTHGSTGTYFDTLSNYLLCDSIVRLNLLVLNGNTTTNLSICNGDSAFLGGAFRTTAGSYFDTLIGFKGCDSILRTNLSIRALNLITINREVCLGESYLGIFYSSDTSWTINYTNIFGCDSIYTTNINVNAIPTVSIGADTCIEVGQSIVLTAFGAADYFWSNGTNSASINVSPTNTTTYFVQGINSDLCSGYDTITICVAENNDTSYYAIPSAFTPNGDGLNDIFKILYTSNLTLENMQIFNRWGELVFVSNDISTGWDGAFRERQQPQGSYVYYLQLRNKNSNKIENYTGTVTLIR